MGKEPPKSALEAARLTRGYVHFDTPLSHNDCKLLVSDPVAVTRHAFYPFIRHDVVRNKFKRIGPGQVKRSKKIRDIRYAAHADAAIYAYYNFTLMEHYEQRLKALGLQANVIAFRALGKSNVDFAQEAFEWIDTHRPCFALGFDVKDFFGSLDHRLLRSQWADLIDTTSLPDDHYAVFKSLTRHASVELIAARKALNLSRSILKRIDRICGPVEFRTVIRDGGLIETNRRACGIPQGSPISAALSNIYMIPFDTKLKAAVEGLGGLYRRYCDDILVIVPDTDVVPIYQLVKAELAALKLDMQDAKTVKSHFEAGKADVPLPYLGLTYDGAQVSLRASGIARFYVKMRRGVAQLRHAKRKDGGVALIVQRRRRLLNRYSEHTPRDGRSYFKYVKMAARKTNSTAIKHQLRAHRRRLKSLIED
ncbi:antiviral reverse transcriptase Drt2 [Pseudoxanthomonas mexicana]